MFLEPYPSTARDVEAAHQQTVRALLAKE